MRELLARWAKNGAIELCFRGLRAPRYAELLAFGSNPPIMPLRSSRVCTSHAGLSIIGLWLSLVERLPRVQEAAGSNPASPTMP